MTWRSDDEVEYYLRAVCLVRAIADVVCDELVDGKVIGIDGSVVGYEWLVDVDV